MRAEKNREVLQVLWMEGSVEELTEVVAPGLTSVFRGGTKLTPDEMGLLWGVEGFYAPPPPAVHPTQPRFFVTFFLWEKKGSKRNRKKNDGKTQGEATDIATPRLAGGVHTRFRLGKRRCHTHHARAPQNNNTKRKRSTQIKLLVTTFIFSLHRKNRRQEYFLNQTIILSKTYAELLIHRNLKVTYVYEYFTI